jgi:DNA-binding transcriptional LysR family regulator
MNMQQLESFIQVAENLNFARAAEAMNITQSAVSRQIRSLEEELGTKLLHRSTRTVVLTPAGISFLSDAKDILIKLQLASQKLKSHSLANIRILSIGCSHESYLPLTAQLLQKCRKQFPEIHPFFRNIPSRAILNLLIHDEIDILFGFQDDIPLQTEFCYYELAQIPICFAMHKDHPLAQKETLTEQELETDQIVLCNSYELPATVSNIQSRLARKFSPNATNYCENLAIMLTLIRTGYGIGILPKIPSTDEGIVYLPLNPALSLSYGFFYKKTSKNPVAKDFLSLMGIKI